MHTARVALRSEDYTEASWSDLRQDSPANPRHRIPLLYKSLNETNTVYVKAGGFLWLSLLLVLVWEWGCDCGCGFRVVWIWLWFWLWLWFCATDPRRFALSGHDNPGSADELGLGGGGVRIRLPQSIHVPTMITSIRLRPFPQSIHVPTMITSRSDSIHSCGASMSQP